MTGSRKCPYCSRGEMRVEKDGWRCNNCSEFIAFHSKSEMRRVHIVSGAKDLPAYCNYCRKETETKDWDCVECGLSKGHPGGLDLIKDTTIEAQSIGEFGSVTKVRLTHNPTGITVQGEAKTLQQNELKARLLKELNQKVRDK